MLSQMRNLMQALEATLNPPKLHLWAPDIEPECLQLALQTQRTQVVELLRSRCIEQHTCSELQITLNLNLRKNLTILVLLCRRPLCCLSPRRRVLRLIRSPPGQLKT